MLTSIVEQQQTKSSVLNLIISIKTLILMVETVLILHLKYYLKVDDLRRMQLGTIVMEMELRHGLMLKDLRTIC